MGFFVEMPYSFNLIVHVDHPLIKQLVENANNKFGGEVAPINHDIKAKTDELDVLRKENSSKKEDEIAIADKEKMTHLEKEIADLTAKEDSIIAAYASTDEKLRHLIDLSLLSNNMLKGEHLNKFIKRSINIL